MKIIRILNNNVVEACHEGREVVAMGKGLAFGCKAGDEVKEELVEKRFELSSGMAPAHLAQMLTDIPFAYWDFAASCEGLLRNTLKREMPAGFYIALADHLYIAVQRAKEGQAMPMFAANELRFIYRNEIEAAREIVRLAEQTFDVSFKENETYFIALHIIDSEYDANPQALECLTAMLEQILAIVRADFPQALHEDTLNYERFLLHLRFFLERLLLRTGNGPPIDGMEEIYTDFRRHYPAQHRCEQRIRAWLEQKMAYTLSIDEEFYILLHLIKVTMG